MMSESKSLKEQIKFYALIYPLVGAAAVLMAIDSVADLGRRGWRRLRYLTLNQQQRTDRDRIQRQAGIKRD